LRLSPTKIISEGHFLVPIEAFNEKELDRPDNGPPRKELEMESKYR